MTISTEVATTRHLLHAADTDIAAFFDFFDDNCTFRMGNNPVIHGRDNIATWVAGYLGNVASMEHHIIEEWHAETVAALRVDVTYTMRSGERITLPAVTRTTVENNKITEYLIFIDASPIIAAS
ncbi:nuclear transport factor 2 family protein [Antrihabitans spumae]|uniref:Nuclear transport factor 2 family protein n=1 Tax=Antrihabitans spumae TaxID=3373370 RepID=A0ABW7JTT5_9NOCA